MTLTPKPDTREQFFVSLELVCPHLPNFRRHYPFTVNAQAQRISLYAFEEDIQQMLGTTSNQDAFVRISVETDRILKQLNIVRYDARLEGPSPAGRLEVVTDTLCESENSVRVSGMRLDDPRAIPVEVPERVSQGVGMGVFEIPLSGVNYLVRSATTMMAGWVVLLFTLSSLLKLLLSSVAFPL
ncbi:hypothetical protein LWH94_19250 [Marinobacter sp. G11]|uniref:hypothetical protein n=1 Tax=Marinobacter sp. G11 TaxID=2903522 RepID=UPI001E5E7C31|nr:hypothetical protein [Marinobacter sp. G11]MCE0761290.1 hypothetical protein [Marinobacter sp. G11]